MTIKEAFEKLVDTTAAAMKNPFFVMRKLHSAFVDIADNIEGGGGGSTVEVEAIQTTGTKIATISVDDVDTDLYAPTPTPASEDYSTTERVVGKWIDGTTDVYEKVFTLDSFTIPASGVDYWNLMTGVSELISFFGTFDVSYGQKIAMNATIFDDTNTTDSIKSYVAVYPNSNDTLAVKFGQKGSASSMTITNLHAVVRYTKTSS